MMTNRLLKGYYNQEDNGVATWKQFGKIEFHPSITLSFWGL